MEYVTIKEISQRWRLGSRVVTLYCSDGRITGAIKKGNLWLIPKDAPKPLDGRRRKNDHPTKIADDVHFDTPPHFRADALRHMQETLFPKIIESFPYPIQVYRPDGLLMMTNDACIRMMHIPTKEHIVGKFNVLKDPVVDQWGDTIREQMARSFNGETVHLQHVYVPIRGIIDRFDTGELCFDSCYQNITCYPINNDQSQLSYVVHVFVTTKLYDGKEEMVKAKEYIESHWLEEFDIEALSAVVNLSRYHFTRLFKSNTGMTPYGYYQDIKIRNIKERLRDHNLSVAQAFRSCGVDYNGNYARIFKARVGMTPSQYRHL